MNALVSTNAACAQAVRVVRVRGGAYGMDLVFSGSTMPRVGLRRRWAMPVLELRST
jgi:hypothetical protein